jgi:hypothetical protein
MNIDRNPAKKVFFIAVVVSLFFAALVQVSSEEKVKISGLESEKIGEDTESQELLREQYGDLLGYVKTGTKFNSIATKDNIAVINITVNGKNRRILTKIHRADVPSAQIDLTNAKLIRTESLIVLGNISLGKNLFFDVDNEFGSRRLFGLGSATLRYVDEGFSRLVDGKANVSINPVFREIISGYNVFLSAEGFTRGIYIAEKTHSYFVVKSVNSGSNVGFSWMLRGVKSDYDEGYLVSKYGEEKGIGITATIDFEDGNSKVVITGLNEILVLVNETTISTPDSVSNSTANESNNNGQNNGNENNNSNNGRGIKLITGNLVDEFGLETDLGQILGDAASLPESTDENNDSVVENSTQINNSIINNTTNTTSNETVLGNETTTVEEISILEFTLYSTDEGLIIDQVSSVTGLRLEEVKKLINFVYTKPAGFEDELIEAEAGRIEGIEKINGSVVIRLG